MLPFDTKSVGFWMYDNSFLYEVVFATSRMNNKWLPTKIRKLFFNTSQHCTGRYFRFPAAVLPVDPKIMKTRGVHLQHYNLSLFIAVYNFSSRPDWQWRIFLRAVLLLQVKVMRLQKPQQKNVTVFLFLFHFSTIIQNNKSFTFPFICPKT